ncbi:ankyrin [Lentithecium fluviatile CBS 122367]|uniref:Ankyrin n=1 Tax=Lentithecium fluviatile CBS 122367 TaxID=1168545 RepID=A0A6G1JJW9_9PLEO|nr:ankyrin [Lentithecium fluviatile CBS 122367]
MDILKLPLELFRAILAEAMLARGLTRALRLRLVNKFFAAEVVRMLAELKILDEVEVVICETGPIGAEYITRRLLSSQSTLSPRLDNIRQIVSRLTLEGAAGGDGSVVDSAERYSAYIGALSSLLAKRCSFYMKSLFTSQDSTADSIFEYDLLTAAAYTSKLSIVKELSDREANTRVTTGTFGNPYAAATLGGHLMVLDHLLQQAELHKNGPSGIWWTQLCSASQAGSRKVVEHLLTAKWSSSFKKNHSSFTKFHEALRTPDVDTFNLLMQFKPTSDGTIHEPLTGAQRASLLLFAATNGSTEMVAHLLGLRTPTAGEDLEQIDMQAPLSAACRYPAYPAYGSGFDAILRLLLQKGAKPKGDEIGRAAEKGRLGSVRILAEHGMDVKCGAATPGYRSLPTPIVSAVRLEHTKLFCLLMKHGAVLAGEVGVAATKLAKEEGLESMLALLEEHGVNTEDADWKM